MCVGQRRRWWCVFTAVHQWRYCLAWAWTAAQIISSCNSIFDEIIPRRRGSVNIFCRLRKRIWRAQAGYSGQMCITHDPASRLTHLFLQNYFEHGTLITLYSWSSIAIFSLRRLRLTQIRSSGERHAIFQFSRISGIKYALILCGGAFDAFATQHTHIYFPVTALRKHSRCGDERPTKRTFKINNHLHALKLQ